MLGPHFYFDVIRLARKGWPTLLRVVYLLVMLVSLAVVYEGGGQLVKPRDFAERAQHYASMLIAVQYVLILALLPVYVASAVVEEKENFTLEALSLTHLTDHELVHGKLGARLAHVAALLLAGFPLLAFMNLWGNVSIAYLLYHEACALLLLLTAGSVCIYISTRCDRVFQAISQSYPWMAGVGVLGVGIILALSSAATNTTGADSFAGYGIAFIVVATMLLPFAYLALDSAVRQMMFVRLRAANKVRKPPTAFTLTDAATPRARPGWQGRWHSRIHPLALPVCEPAMFWKECLKDGTRWSLTYGWLLIAIAAVVGVGITIFGLRSMLPISRPNGQNLDFLGTLAACFAYTAYVVAFGAYLLVVLLQTTMSVAAEQEQDTLVFLLLIPEERRSILFMKWLGPLWRNWPILAIGLLGALLGFVSGVYSLQTFLALVLLPIPFVLMLTCYALWLSTTCRRVLFANLGMVGLLVTVVVAHLAGWAFLSPALAVYFSLISGKPLRDLTAAPADHALLLAFSELGGVLVVAFVTGTLAYRRFMRADFAAVR